MTEYTMTIEEILAEMGYDTEEVAEIMEEL